MLRIEPVRDGIQIHGSTQSFLQGFRLVLGMVDFRFRKRTGMVCRSIQAIAEVFHSLKIRYPTTSIRAPSAFRRVSMFW